MTSMSPMTMVAGSLDVAMSEDVKHIDPWTALSRLLAGVLVYGAAGYGLDYWWGTSFMVGIGIVLGAVLGIYAVVAPTRIQ